MVHLQILVKIHETVTDNIMNNIFINTQQLLLFIIIYINILNYE